MLKGVLFNVSRTALEDEFGRSVWDQIQDLSGLRDQYEDFKNYTLDEWEALIETSGKLLDESRRSTARWFGNQWIPELRRRHPELFEEFSCPRELLEAARGYLFPRIKKLYPGIQLPDFQLQEKADNQFTLTFVSRDDLCALAEGLLEGLGKLYSTPLEMTQPRCVIDGDSQCTLEVTVQTA